MDTVKASYCADDARAFWYHRLEWSEAGRLNHVMKKIKDGSFKGRAVVAVRESKVEAQSFLSNDIGR